MLARIINTDVVVNLLQVSAIGGIVVKSGTYCFRIYLNSGANIDIDSSNNEQLCDIQDDIINKWEEVWKSKNVLKPFTSTQ